LPIEGFLKATLWTSAGVSGMTTPWWLGQQRGATKNASDPEQQDGRSR
jgi:hypothetical protein